MGGIKFRAWHKKRKKYYKVLHLHLDDLGGIWATCEGFDIIEQKEIHIQIQPKDCIIVQYTGLKDKNGKDIYEGDIVSSLDFYPSEVKYNDNYAQFVATDINFLDSEQQKWEVIGNIYENPELLGNDKEGI